MHLFLIVSQAFVAVAGGVVALLASRHRLHFGMTAGALMCVLALAHLFTHTRGIDWAGPWFVVAEIMTAWAYGIAALRGWRFLNTAERACCAYFAYAALHLAALFSGRPAFAASLPSLLVLMFTLFVFVLFYLPYSFARGKRLARHAEELIAELARDPRHGGTVDLALLQAIKDSGVNVRRPAIRRTLGLPETPPDQG